MNEVMKFNNEEFGEVRIVVLNGKEYFNLEDVCFKLGYVKIAKGKEYLRKDLIEGVATRLDVKGLSMTDNDFISITKQIVFNEYYISEEDLYDFIFESRCDNARKFRGDDVNMKNNWRVYIHENKINGKMYVGITGREPEKRWLKGKGYTKSKTVFSSAISKYGWDGFYHYVISDKLTKVEAEKEEIDFIKIWNLTDREYGYNIARGGYEGLSKNVSSELLGKKVECDGVVYDCIKDCADKYNVNYQTMVNWLNTGKAPKKFVKLNLKLKDNDTYVENFNGSNKIKVECDGNVFDCVKDCAEYYMIKRSTMKNWLNGNSKMPNAWYEKGLMYVGLDYDNRIVGEKEKVTISYEGKIYESISDFCKEFGLYPSRVSRWLSWDRKPSKEWANIKFVTIQC